MKCAVEMDSDGMIYIYIPSLIKIGTGVEWFHCSNLKGCNICITDGRDL
jgi:hypothetical protein